MIAKIERAAAVREPAHDDAVASDDLLPVDAEVLPALLGPARHGETPGDERAGIPGPAGLHRQAPQIDVVSFPDDFLNRCRGAFLRRHVEHLLEYRELVPQVAQPLGGLGLLQVGKQLSYLK